MFHPFKTALLSFVALSAMALMAIAVGSTTYAADQPTITAIPLEITPVCSDAPSLSTYWNVYNKNAFDVQIDWSNDANSLTGTYAAPAGFSHLITGYNPNDGNNTTGFIWEGSTTHTNAPSSPCDSAILTPAPIDTDPTPTTPVCINGSIQQNLVVTYLTDSTVSIKTANGTPLCDDVTIYFSSYIMPANYDGKGFYNNDTSYPQTQYSSTSTTLKKGTDGDSILSISLPSYCNNIQVDVYYGPEIKTVGVGGHGTQNILSQVYLSDGSCEMGGGGVLAPITPEPPVTPPVVVPEEPVVEPTLPSTQKGNGAVSGYTPAELPVTGGISPLITLLDGSILAAFAYGITYAIQPRKNRIHHFSAK